MEIAERFGGKLPTPDIRYHFGVLNAPVDPDQACENISYARAQNSEVTFPLPPLTWF